MASLYDAMLDDTRWPAASALIDEACGAGGGAGLRERLSFHLEVDGRVPVRGRDAGVAKPLTDRDDVDAGAEQVDGRAVPHAVGMETLSAQGRDGGLRLGAVLL